MASNSFGEVFRISTWGESHGEAVGVLIDGCPAGIPLEEATINAALARRAPGRSAYTSPRKEPDRAEILSGLYEGRTSGAPVSILIRNKDADSSKYTPIKHLLRAGHANYSYLEKYGVFDYRGGGRASARETACRVAAGAVASCFLKDHGIVPLAYLKQVGNVIAEPQSEDPTSLQQDIDASELFCPDPAAAQEMATLIAALRDEGDSIGGVVEFAGFGVPAGLGDPVYQKIEAQLASAMMSLPASKGFEMGSGFAAVSMRGSEHNDPFVSEDGVIRTDSNHAGGCLGGISTGMPLIGRVAFKPTSSIMKPYQTVDQSGQSAPFQLPEGSRHDPCVTVRAVPVVEAMLALCLADALLRQRLVRAQADAEMSVEELSVR